VVLEQGDWPDYSKARANHSDFELTAGRNWSANPNRRQAPADYPIDDSQSDISAVLYNAVGGGTVIYAAHWQRNMPSDFRVRTLDGVADDWPLTYEELQPYYERVESDFGVSGLEGDTAFPPGKGPPLPPGPLAPMGRRVARAIINWAGIGGRRRMRLPRDLMVRSSRARNERHACGVAWRARRAQWT
jgi:choline dehydrogenase-like flavoprotein